METKNCEQTEKDAGPESTMTITSPVAQAEIPTADAGNANMEMKQDLGQGTAVTSSDETALRPMESDIKIENQIKPAEVPAINPVVNTAPTTTNLPMRKRKQGCMEEKLDDSKHVIQPVVDSKKPKPDLSDDEAKDPIAQELAEALALSGGIALTKLKTETPDAQDPIPSPNTTEVPATTPINGIAPIKRMPMSKAREIRLEQNRKAARESRRRKKIMIEELQRSVIFFSRANGTLKQRNDELERLLLQAKGQVQAFEDGKHQAAAAAEGVDETAVGDGSKPETKEAEANGEDKSPSSEPGDKQEQPEHAPDTTGHNNLVRPEDNGLVVQPQSTMPPMPQLKHQQIQLQRTQCEEAKQAQTVSQQAQAQQAVACAQAQQQAQAHAARAAATQAMFESHGFPPIAARAAAQTFVTSSAPPLVGHMNQPQIHQNQMSTTDASSAACNNGSVPQAQLSQPQKAPTLQAGGHNPWQSIMAMQAQPMQAQPMQTQPVQTQPMQTQPMQTQPMQTQPMQTQPMQTQPMQAQPMQAQLPGATAPSPAGHINATGQAPAQAEKSLKDTFLAIQQQYNRAACNPLVMQPVPVPNNISPPMLGQQQSMVPCPSQPQSQPQDMIKPSVQKDEQHVTPSNVAESHSQVKDVIGTHAQVNVVEETTNQSAREELNEILTGEATADL